MCRYQRVNSDGADINCDGIVNAKDLLISKKCNAGLDDLSNYQDNGTINCFAIAGVDISEFCIVVPEWATEDDNILYAANRASELIGEATGHYLKVYWGEKGEGCDHAINFCDVPEGSELEEQLYIENYIYEVKNGDLNIYGTRRGNMYAVYDIAEEYLGYRFYLNDYVYQYADRYVEISEGTYVFRQPAVTYRMGGVGGSRGSELSELRAFARKLNAYQLGGYAEKKFGTVSGPHFINAHYYGYYWRMATGVVDVYFNEDRSNTNDYEAKYDASVQQDEYA